MSRVESERNEKPIEIERRGRARQRKPKPVKYECFMAYVSESKIERKRERETE